MQREREPIVEEKKSHTAKQKGVFEFNRRFIQGMLKETDLEYNMRIYDFGCRFATYKMQQHYPKMSLSEVELHVDEILIEKGYWNFWVNVFHSLEKDFCNISMYDETIDPDYFRFRLETEIHIMFGTRLLDCNFWNYIERTNYE